MKEQANSFPALAGVPRGVRDPTDPYIAEQSGLCGWFTPPEAPLASPPARVRLAPWLFGRKR